MPDAISYAVNCSILFTELPLLRRPAAARAAGFDAVEFWWPFAEPVPGDAAADEFVAAIADAGVGLAALNFFGGDLPAGERGVLSWPESTAAFRENVAAALELGARLGCRSFNALYGNRVAGLAEARQDELARENLAFAAEAAARMDATVLLEPISGVATHPLRTAADVFAVLDAVRRENLALLADLYHLSVNGDDLDALPAHVARIGHVQIADAPGRGQPGTGALDIQRHLDALAAAGYRGWVGLEYKPTQHGGTPDSMASFDWLPAERRGSSG